jgi:hypothetical protein
MSQRQRSIWVLDLGAMMNVGEEDIMADVATKEEVEVAMNTDKS